MIDELDLAKLARVNVVGTTGSGKSTFARKLAAALDHPHIEMDQVFWEPNWKEPSNEVFFARLEQAIAKPSWVLDGNYDRTLHIKWKDVTAVVWLDCELPRNLFQSFKRSIGRAVSKRELWPGTGNKESFARMFSKDSILLWLLKTHKKNRERYLERMNDSRYSHIKFYRIRSHKEADSFIAAVRAHKAGSAGVRVL